MRKRIVVWAWLVVPVLLTAVPRANAQELERSLSPYFEVEGGVDCFPLAGTEIDVHVQGVIASVTVRQVYENRGGVPIHARYVFPASTRAAVSGLRMRIGVRVVEAVIREKHKAREEYQAAKREGRNAALLEQVRPNVFDMRVANVMPGDRVEVELRYSELLVPTDGVYEFVYPTVVGPRYLSGAPLAEGGSEALAAATPFPGEAAPGRASRHDDSPAGPASAAPIRIDATVSAGMPIRWVSVPSHAVELRWSGQRRVAVALAPSERGANRDYVLRYGLAGDEVASGLLLERGADENFFLLMVEPPARVRPEQFPPREFVFVVDVSGSMKGFPLDVSKTLVRDLVAGLRPSDLFNVVLFAGSSTLFESASVPATPKHVVRALRLIDEQAGGGGTELPVALRRALTLPRAGPMARAVVILTDGYIGAEQEAFSVVRDHLGDASVFAFGIGRSVNRYLVEGIARAGLSEPFVVLDEVEAAETAERFRDYVSAPVLTDIVVDFGDLEVYDVEPERVPDALAERPVVVKGKWRGPASGSVTLRGFGGAGAYSASFALSDAAVGDGAGLRYLWARARIDALSDGIRAGAPDAVRAEITRLGLHYGLLTRYTSFVAVDRVVRNPDGRGHDALQPNPLPEGVSESPPAPSLQVMPEPELWLLVVGVLALLALRRLSLAVRLSRRTAP